MMPFPQPMNISDLIEHKRKGTRPEVPDEVIPGFVVGSVAGLVAPGGLGKTYYLLNLLHLLSLSYELWHPFFKGENATEAPKANNIKTGRVLYINLEDPLSVLENRTFDLINAITDSEANAFNDSVDIVPYNGLNFCLLNADGKRNDPEISNLKVQLQKGKYRLLILDTLRRTHLSDENNGGHMSALLGIFEEIAREFTLGVLFSHHCNKFAIQNGSGDIAQSSRGSVVLVDNIRFQINLCGLSVEECQSDYADGIFETPAEAVKAGGKQLYRGYFLRSCGAKLNNADPGANDHWYWRGPGGVLRRITTPAEFAKLWWEKIDQKQVFPKRRGNGSPSRRAY